MHPALQPSGQVASTTCMPRRRGLRLDLPATRRARRTRSGCRRRRPRRESPPAPARTPPPARPDPRRHAGCARSGGAHTPAAGRPPAPYRRPCRIVRTVRIARVHPGAESARVRQAPMRFRHVKPPSNRIHPSQQQSPILRHGRRQSTSAVFIRRISTRQAHPPPHRER